MGRVTTNTVTIGFAREASLGVLPGSPAWNLVEPNNINRFGATIGKVARSPISKARQRRKGVVTTHSAAVEFEADFTLSHLKYFLEGFMMARATGPDLYAPSAVLSGGYTVAALSAGQAAEFTYGASAAKTLVYGDGFTNTVNNGIREITGTVATSAVLIPVSGSTAETPAATVTAQVAIAGVRGWTGDLQINAGGNLISTVLDFTTLGLTVGQYIHVGGVLTANQFATVANLGFARIVSIAANLIVLAKKNTTFVADTGSGLKIDILFGQFVRNVDVGHADYLEISSQFELTNPNLGIGGVNNYEYALGCYHNALSFNIPLQDKVTCSFGFVAKDVQRPTASRATNAASAKEPNETAAFSSSTDIARLRVQNVDETGLTSDFKSMTFTMTNNVGPEYVVGALTARYMNVGNFEVDLNAQILFTEPLVIDRIRSNTTIGFDFCLYNGDGGAYFDIPSGTLGGGDRSYPPNQTVLMNTVLMAHKDETLGYSVSASFFPVLPAQAAP